MDQHPVVVDVTDLEVAGHSEEELQRNAARVESVRRDPDVDHAKLVGAQFIRRGRVRRVPEKCGEILGRSKSCILGFHAFRASSAFATFQVTTMQLRSHGGS